MKADGHIVMAMLVMFLSCFFTVGYGFALYLARDTWIKVVLGILLVVSVTLMLSLPWTSGMVAQLRVVGNAN